MSREVLQQTYTLSEENVNDLLGWLRAGQINRAVIALEHLNPAELAQPEQEPAFYGFMLEEECCVNICYSPCGPGGPNNELPTAYYTSPPQRQPLTDDEIVNLRNEHRHWYAFARAIEAAHGIGDKT